MIKIIKEKLPVGCVIVEKMEPDPMICPIENSGLKVALKFLESSHGTPDESYVIIDKKTIDPIFINVIKNIISGMKCRNMQRIRLDDIVSHFSDEEDGKLIWKCPNCGNTDQSKMNVARRTCGYIGSQFWNQGRTQEIKERVLHL